MSEQKDKGRQDVPAPCGAAQEESLKTCVTCRHSRRGASEYFCDLYGRKNPVTGLYGLAFCELVRCDERCGPSGKMWKPIEAQAGAA